MEKEMSGKTCNCCCIDCIEGRHCGDIYHLIESDENQEMEGRCNDPTYYLDLPIEEFVDIYEDEMI